MSRLRNAGLYPDVDAPEFQINGQAQHGGRMVRDRHAYALSSQRQTVYYTLDGSDPRTPGAAEAPSEEFPLVTEEAAKKVIVPTGAIDNAWRSATDFDDAAWIDGTGGVGYERSSGYESFITIDLHDAMHGANASCYIRIPFSLSPNELIDASGLKLKVRYDDASSPISTAPKSPGGTSTARPRGIRAPARPRVQHAPLWSEMGM